MYVHPSTSLKCSAIERPATYTQSCPVLIHLSIYSGCTIQTPIQSSPKCVTLPLSSRLLREHRKTTMLFSYIINKLHDNNSLATRHHQTFLLFRFKYGAIRSIDLMPVSKICNSLVQLWILMN